MAQAIAICLAEQMGWELDKVRYAGDPATREPAITFTDDERKAMRTARMRGASLGKVALSAEIVAQETK